MTTALLLLAFLLVHAAGVYLGYQVRHAPVEPGSEPPGCWCGVCGVKWVGCERMCERLTKGD